MICHYFIIAKGHLQILDFYTSNSIGLYYYTEGWKYRAYNIYFVSIAPNFYGFLRVFGVNITTVATRMYYFCVPCGAYLELLYILCALLAGSSSVLADGREVAGTGGLY
jgi:NCS1 family nucleobase:cation symporter-1